MKNIAIIYPHQLFEIKYLPYDENDIDTFVITEDPIFFADTERNLKFNMLKLIYQRASMMYYRDYLKENGFKVKYINYGKKSQHTFNEIIKLFGKNHTIHIIDPVDHLLESRININSKKFKIEYYETPAFLSASSDLQEYIDKYNPGLNKRFLQHSFYIWQRHRLNILLDSKNKPIGGSYSYDSQNRDPIPGRSFDSFINKNKIKLTKKLYDNKYYKEAITYCTDTFENHYPELFEPDNIYQVPITHADTKTHLKLFITERLRYFGDYEDAIDNNTENVVLFHSMISPQLNNGLITPNVVLKNILEFYEKSNIKKEILPDIEGFIRQLNWREYSRLLYVYVADKMKGNFFLNKKRLNDKWYSGETGIVPIDSTIKIAFRYGYLHHILRLMVMSNFMNLCQIHPDDVYAWFMEFSLDSYDWVMINNVYSMGLHADGGLTTTKPYISSSNYVIKQSNFKADGHWDKIWTDLYYYFIYTNQVKIKGRGAYYLSQWNANKDKNNIIERSKDHLKKLTK